jgi:hypothetical protein
MQLKRTTLTALIIVLATLSFATAAITLTNITEWHVRSAGTPPIVKVVGKDAVYGDATSGQLANVTIKTATDGTNRTIITIRGYTGDPTYYSEVIKICNKGSQTYQVKLVANGVLNGNWDYVQYLKLWLNNQGPLELKNGQTTGETPQVSVPAGDCVPVSAEVLVKATDPLPPTNQDLVVVEVDVVSSTG